ncbi:DUF2812 domain-containing protein [Peribacillus sp. NPDC096540]|uniref:DUF2812 domain-containing protein n=1 Tax=Peribacillus sp. NPDC096540 TaxID=3390612 RepID=UPI003D0945BB
MVRTKYVMSNGLAFAEEKDMKKMRQKALDGWHLKSFRFAGYELEKGDPEDIIYSIDYRTLQSNEEDEYFEMFSYAGWTHVCSSQDMHIFKAKKGTMPIYSDRESTIEKIERLANPLKGIVAFFVTMTVILWLMMTFTSGLVQSISEWAFILSFVLTIPAIMTYMATYYHKWKKGLGK